jgi:multidrug efflux pump
MAAMNFSTPFIHRPVATILLSIGLMLSGLIAYRFLPVAALPSIDIPTIVVFAARPGADPETMANSIAAPLERRLGEIAGVTEITSTSAIGNTAIVIQFDIDRDINGAAHDVQAAINAATTDLPSDLPTRPFYRKFNPADAPVMVIALSSATLSTAQIYDAADTVLAQRLSQSSTGRRSRRCASGSIRCGWQRRGCPGRTFTTRCAGRTCWSRWAGSRGRTRRRASASTARCGRRSSTGR